MGGGYGGYQPPVGGPGVDNNGQGFGGCFGCSYVGDYYSGYYGGRRPAPPKRFQGEWRNGWWYY